MKTKPPEGHLLEVIGKSAPSEMEGLLKSNSYRPIMLIDAVGQKAIEHFLDDEASQDSSVQTNQSSAVLGLRSINGVPMMSSRSIATLTQRKHFHLLRDVRKYLDSFGSPNMDNPELARYYEENGANNKLSKKIQCLTFTYWKLLVKMQ
jgi:hypothetical protein